MEFLYTHHAAMKETANRLVVAGSTLLVIAFFENISTGYLIVSCAFLSAAVIMFICADIGKKSHPPSQMQMPRNERFYNGQHFSARKVCLSKHIKHIEGLKDPGGHCKVTRQLSQ